MVEIELRLEKARRPSSVYSILQKVSLSLQCCRTGLSIHPAKTKSMAGMRDKTISYLLATHLSHILSFSYCNSLGSRF